MNDFQELLLLSSDDIVAALGQLTDPMTVLDGDANPLDAGWVPWND